MEIQLKYELIVTDLAARKSVTVPARLITLEQIPNPLSPMGEPWLVLPGTTTGACIRYWLGCEMDGFKYGKNFIFA